MGVLCNVWEGAPHLEKRNINAITMNLEVSTPFAGGRITPKHKRHDSKVYGFQATCKIKNHGSCNKTCMVKTGMDEDTVMRMVKYWMVLGNCIEEDTEEKPSDRMALEAKARAKHKSMWNMVDLGFRDGSVPSHAELDWLAEQLVSMQSSSGEDHSGGSGAAASSAPRTPPHIHEACQKMMQEGTTPKTTVEQRVRNAPVPGTTYITPPVLTAALRWGYISANLPNPPNYRWQGEHGKWFLVPIYKGG